MPEAGKRLDLYVAEETGLSRSRAQQLITEGLVLVCGAPREKNYKLRAGDEVSITLPEAREPEALPEDIPVEIVYEDEWLLVVNKPKGMVVHPAPVSYTHLDVYKRQGHRRGDGCEDRGERLPRGRSGGDGVRRGGRDAAGGCGRHLRRISGDAAARAAGGGRALPLLSRGGVRGGGVSHRQARGARADSLRADPRLSLIHIYYAALLAARADELVARGERRPRALIETYGCQQNVADSDRMRGMLELCGYDEAESRADADFILFNTCAVRELSLIHIYHPLRAI